MDKVSPRRLVDYVPRKKLAEVFAKTVPLFYTVKKVAKASPKKISFIFLLYNTGQRSHPVWKNKNLYGWGIKVTVQKISSGELSFFYLIKGLFEYPNDL